MRLVDERCRLPLPAGDAFLLRSGRAAAVDESAERSLPLQELGPVHRRAVAGNQSHERRRRHFFQRLLPPVGAGGIHERHDVDHQIANDRQPRLRIVEPQVRLGYRIGRDMDVELAPGDSQRRRFRDRNRRSQRVGIVDARPATEDLRPLVSWRIGIGQPLVGLLAPASQKALERPFDRRRRRRVRRDKSGGCRGSRSCDRDANGC